MKARAKHWVNYHGVWHQAGEQFDIAPDDAEEMRKYAEVIDTNPDAPPATEPVEEQLKTDVPARRGRKRKTEE